MYVEYYAGNATEDWELAITFEPSEEYEYTATLTGLPFLKWEEQSQSWKQQVRSEVPREVQGTRSSKAQGSRKHIY